MAVTALLEYLDLVAELAIWGQQLIVARSLRNMVIEL